MEKIEDLLNDVKETIGFDEDVKLKVVPMKQKIASISLRTRILRLNRNILGRLDEEEIKYIIAHELIHLKIKDINHGSLFSEESEKVFSFEEAVDLEMSIIEKLL